MKNIFSKFLVRFVTSMMIFGMFGVSTYALPIIFPTINVPWIGNMTVSQSTFDVGSATPLVLKFDYQNIPEGDSLPKAIVYKDGDASKMNLPNYLDYSVAAGVLVQPKPSGTQSGSETLRWYGQASRDTFLDPGQYVFEVSWSNSTSHLGPISQKFTLTNSNHAVPFNIYNVNALPNPFNPQNDSVLHFNYTIKGLAINEKINTNLTVASVAAQKKIYQMALSDLGNGDHSFDWNGKDNASQIAADGSYVFTITGVSTMNREIQSGIVPFQVTTSIDNSVQNPSPSPAPSPSPVTPPQNPSPNPVPVSNSCSGFTDILATDPNCSIYTWVKNAGIFTGNADGSFNPAGFLQRDQVAKTVLVAFGKFKSGTEYCSASNPFPDVTKSAWSREYICLGKKTSVQGGGYLLTGYQAGPNKGLFLPANQVSRSELFAMVFRNLKTVMPSASVKSYVDVELNQWDTGFAAYALQYLSSIYPLPNLSRTQFVTRLEAARLFYTLHGQGVL